jgi:hypothetical protein
VRFLLRAGLAVVVAAVGCGGDEGGDGASSKTLRDAVAKTEAAKTARMTVAISVSGGASESFRGEVLVDFAHNRNHLTMQVEGQTVQLFSDGPDEYIRRGTSGRYQRLPESAQSPVANNPSDSLQYVGTDVVDVTEGDENGCYEGRLDFDLVFKRVEEGREGDLPEGLRGQEAPVLVCVDRAGRIRRYDVDLSVDGTTVKTTARVTDHGRVRPLDPLGPAELPQ